MIAKIKALFSLRPTKFFIRLLIGLFTFGVIIGVLRVFFSESLHDLIGIFTSGFMLAAVTLVLLSIYDWYRGIPTNSIRVVRHLPNSFALNRSQTIQFDLVNESDYDLNIELYDSVPDIFECSDFPLKQTVKASQKGVFQYSVIPKRRGVATFEPSYVLIRSHFGLWQFIKRYGQTVDSKVYPDFSAVSDSFVFGVERAMQNMGAHIAKQKGDGMEFHQLREFRLGDTLKQIDWKATARIGEPISREYQEERDQNVVFLLDCSRRMRAMENNLSYFDYALNALLMSSYIALDKGDAVGVMTFSGEPSWLPPIKGKISINTILNHLYALDTSTQSSDYVSAAEELLSRQRKRSLVILLTNVRDEDHQDLTQAVDILRKQHVVMVVALQERLLQQAENMDLSDSSTALLYAGTKQFQHQRKKMLARLNASGVSVVDATHKDIHVQLVNEYLRLKRSGRI